MILSRVPAIPLVQPRDEGILRPVIIQRTSDVDLVLVSMKFCSLFVI